MNTLFFTQRFPDEAACREHYKNMRIKRGLTCKKCGGTSHFWLACKGQFECKVCHFRTTLRSGTVMEHSHLSFRVWYLAILFMTATKKGISACEMQRQLGYKRYKTVWSLMHRIRTLMGKRDDLYSLTGMIEFDEGFFKVATPEKEHQRLKRGKGSQRLENVGVMVESTPLVDINTGIESKHCRYFKLKALDTQKSESINTLFQNSVTSDSVVFTDQGNNYQDIHKFVDMHITEKSSKNTTKTTLKWAHIAISNAKRTFLGVYHKMSSDYLQNYLNEFTYKLNRRNFADLFQRVIIAAVFPYWYESA
ncbi:MAG: IS1595 family transposase [Bacteroidota bacterium]